MGEIRGVDALTRRERQVADAYVGGSTYRQIGERLGIAPATVRKHLSSIYRKLGVTSKVALLRHLEAQNPVQVAESASGLAERGLPKVINLIFLAPFDGSSGDEAEFGIDLVAELHSRLARLTGLTVTTDRQCARLVIEGKVRLLAGTARIYVRLIETNSGVQVWADRHEIERGDSFETIDRCAARISGAIRWRVAAKQAAIIADHDRVKLSLEQLLVLAGTRSYVPTRSSWLEGGRVAEYALERAPDNAMALAMAATGLGLAEALLGFGHTPHDTFDLALKRIEMALSCNSESYMAHTTRALLLLVARQRHSEAADSAQHALGINAEYSPAHWALGAAQVFSGRWDVGCQTTERATEIDPQDPYMHLYVRTAGFGHLGAGRLDRAAMCFQKCDRLAPGLPQNLAGLAVVRATMGERDAAALAVASLREAEPGLGLMDLCPLPFSEPANWSHFAEGLRSAGMP